MVVHNYTAQGIGRGRVADALARKIVSMEKKEITRKRKRCAQEALVEKELTRKTKRRQTRKCTMVFGTDFWASF